MYWNEANLLNPKLRWRTCLSYFLPVINFLFQLPGLVCCTSRILRMTWRSSATQTCFSFNCNFDVFALSKLKLFNYVQRISPYTPQVLNKIEIPLSLSVQRIFHRHHICWPNLLNSILITSASKKKLPIKKIC